MTQRGPFRYNRRGSCCPLSNHNIAESVAADICQAVTEYAGCVIEVECYTPPYDPPLPVEAARCGGFLVLHLRYETLPRVCVGIEFGRLDKQDQPLRATIDADGWRTDPSSPLSAGVYAANFDEAWRIVCLLGLMLHATGVRLSYGD